MWKRSSFREITTHCCYIRGFSHYATLVSSSRSLSLSRLVYITYIQITFLLHTYLRLSAQKRSVSARGWVTVYISISIVLFVHMLNKKNTQSIQIRMIRMHTYAVSHRLVISVFESNWVQSNQTKADIDAEKTSSQNSISVFCREKTFFHNLKLAKKEQESLYKKWHVVFIWK